MIRIALDAMGGDHAPKAPVDGALAAVERFPDVQVLLVGVPAVLERELSSHGGKPARKLASADASGEHQDAPVAHRRTNSATALRSRGRPGPAG